MEGGELAHGMGVSSSPLCGPGRVEIIEKRDLIERRAAGRTEFSYRIAYGEDREGVEIFR